MKHVKDNSRDDENKLDWYSLCGERVNMLESGYMDIDKAARAIHERRGQPCRRCIQVAIGRLSDGLPKSPSA